MPKEQCYGLKVSSKQKVAIVHNSWDSILWKDSDIVIYNLFSRYKMLKTRVAGEKAAKAPCILSSDNTSVEGAVRPSDSLDVLKFKISLWQILAMTGKITATLPSHISPAELLIAEAVLTCFYQMLELVSLKCGLDVFFSSLWVKGTFFFSVENLLWILIWRWSPKYCYV